MKSFKKIALAMVAAMAMGTLATPASAAPMVVTSVKKNTGTVASPTWTAQTAGTAATSPITIPVPTDNSVDSLDVVEFVLTVDTGTAVTAVAVNATLVPALSATGAAVTASSGTSTLSIATGTGTSADFYVYTKSTAVGSVSITRAGTTTVYYVQGTAGALNSITLTAPASAAAGTSQVLKVSGYDVFGNLKGGATINTLVSSSGAALATALTTDTAVATLGTKEQTVTVPATGSITVVAYATVATAVTGLATPVGSVSATIVVRDIAAELAAKNAELAAANQALATSNAALAAEKAGRAADKAAADSATVTAKAASDLATATAAAKTESF